MKVSEIMDREFTTISKEKNLKEARNLIEKKDLDFLLVEDQEEAVGILTPHDILRFFKKDFEEIRVKKAMKPSIIAIEQTKELENAINKLIKANIDQIFVLEKRNEEKEIIGVLTIQKILEQT